MTVEAYQAAILSRLDAGIAVVCAAACLLAIIAACTFVKAMWQ